MRKIVLITVLLLLCRGLGVAQPRAHYVVYPKNEAEALAYLRGNYKFYALECTDSKFPKTYKLFAGWVAREMGLPGPVRRRVERRLRRAAAVTDRMEYLRDFLRGREAVQPFDAGVLRGMFTEEEYGEMCRLMEREDRVLFDYYVYMNGKIPNVDERGRFYRDIDELVILYRRVFGVRRIYSTTY